MMSFGTKTMMQNNNKYFVCERTKIHLSGNIVPVPTIITYVLYQVLFLFKTQRAVSCLFVTRDREPKTNPSANC